MYFVNLRCTLLLHCNSVNELSRIFGLIRHGAFIFNCLWNVLVLLYFLYRQKNYFILSFKAKKDEILDAAQIKKNNDAYNNNILYFVNRVK